MLLVLVAEHPFTVVAAVVFIALAGIFFHIAMKRLAFKFSILQNRRHEAINQYVGLNRDEQTKTIGLIPAVSAIFPYKLIQVCMGTLMKPLIDLAMISFVVYLALSDSPGSQTNAIIAGIGATGWRAIGPLINAFIASGQIRYGYSQLHPLWKKVLLK